MHMDRARCIAYRRQRDIEALVDYTWVGEVLVCSYLVRPHTWNAEGTHRPRFVEGHQLITEQGADCPRWAGPDLSGRFADPLRRRTCGHWGGEHDDHQTGGGGDRRDSVYST